MTDLWLLPHQLSIGGAGTDHHSGRCYDQTPGVPGGGKKASNLSCVAHFTTNDDLSVWKLQERLNTRPALEPTFVYEGVVGNLANVTHAVARTIDPLCKPGYGSCEDIGLYRVTWVPMGTPPPPPTPPLPPPPPPQPRVCTDVTPVEGLCFTGEDLKESFQILRSAPHAPIACRDACCRLSVCQVRSVGATPARLLAAVITAAISTW
jgi:hypothetical protein